MTTTRNTNRSETAAIARAAACEAEADRRLGAPREALLASLTTEQRKLAFAAASMFLRGDAPLHTRETFFRTFAKAHKVRGIGTTVDAFVAAAMAYTG